MKNQFMNKYIDILTAIINNDIEFADSLMGLLKHRIEMKTTAQMNYLSLLDKSDNKYFFKLFILENNKWNFFDYGFLQGTEFYGLKSKQLIFSFYDYVLQLMRKPNTDNQVIVVTNNKSYLLFTPYSQVVDLLFDSIYNN